MKRNVSAVLAVLLFAALSAATARPAFVTSPCEGKTGTDLRDCLESEYSGSN